MPQGQLYLRSKETRQLSAGAAGLVAYAARPASWGSVASETMGTGWVDAYVRYGLSLEDGARSKLMTPAPKKKPTSSSDATTSGVAYYGATIGKTDEHAFMFDVHITAPDKATFLERYGLFCQEILDCQYFQLRTADRPASVRHLLYESCEPFREYRLEMAKFTLAVTEPHPEITDERVPTIMNVTNG